MKMKEVTLQKTFKKGLPNYSNITVGAVVTYEIGENEEIDWDGAWDEINKQLTIQSDNTDPSWVTHKDTKDTHVTTIRSKKQQQLSIV